MRTAFFFHLLLLLLGSWLSGPITAQITAPLKAARQVAPRETEESLLEKMQGQWEVNKATFNGKPVPLDVKTELAIKGTEYRLTMPGGEDKGELKVDTTEVPYRLTIEGREGPNKGTTIASIIKFEEDQMIICYRLDGSTDRVEKFESYDGSGLLLASYRRAKKADGK